MTKKDYIKIAAVFTDYQAMAENMPANGGWRETASTELANRLANMLAQDNPRFDRARFLTACGVQ